MKVRVLQFLAAVAALAPVGVLAQERGSAASTSSAAAWPRPPSDPLDRWSTSDGEAWAAPRAEAPNQGQNARSTAGVTGQRQSIYDADVPVDPLARIDTRIYNRVQNRIRNRIDRYYDPQANATAPFTVASDQARRRQPPRSR